ncbi:MAG: YafY family transcriptional regulator [Lachnospiraceae bacterium]|nr:YafY family transcriptional regulator [Lachnospiraceae bacterium]
MINRLLSIIYILMNKGTVTAGELARRFEVSVRTIYRDIDTLSMAGIPVYTTKGRNGGISLTEQFVLDKMLVSKKEQQQILAALASLQETGAHEEEEILNKLGEFFKENPQSWVAIDFSDWSGRRKELFNQIKDAILGRHVLQFDYYGQYGDMSSRCVEPVQLLFKEYTWYVRAFCRSKQAMRLFKVLRMKRVTVLDETFEPRVLSETADLPEDAKPNDMNPECGNITADIDWSTEITLWIDKKEAYRIYDRFDESEISVLPDGHFIVKFNCPLDDWTYGLILSFGPSAKVLTPEFVKTEVHRRISEMGRLYE